MEPLEAWDAAWLAGEPVPVPEPDQQAGINHPQIHVLQHAAEQLRAARYWPHTDPDVGAAHREVIDALADELRHHTQNETALDTDTEENDMAGEATITVIGNLTADPELRFTPSGSAVANFTVASTPRTYDRQTNEWKDGETLFLRASLWREPAENIAESLTKGMRVIAQGRLKSRTYETKEGEKRTVVELEVEEIGPSLRYATARVSRSQGRTGQDAAQAGPAQEDPWAPPPPRNGGGAAPH
jgi:single stranded DNA-binding protein